MQPLIEEWADIPGYRGEYQVSSAGRVRVTDRTINRMGRDGLVHQVFRPGRIITPKVRGGYLSVKLWLDGKSKQFNIHRLVATAFHGGASDSLEVNHKDENKHNNEVGNLEWCGRSYNQTYSKGPLLTACKDGEEIVVKGVRQMAKTIGINKTSVQRMLRGEYKTVKGWEVRY